jgi:hypothetical protein
MRAKVILPNLFVVLALGFGAFFWLKSDLHEKATARLRMHLGITGELLRRSESLRGHELLADVMKQSMSKDVTQAFAAVDYTPAEGESPEQTDAKIRQTWSTRSFHAVEIYSELWGVKYGKKPDVVFLTDRKGVVLSRNTTPNACPTGKDVSESIPVVGSALQGGAAYSLWSPDNSGFGKNATASSTSCTLMNSGLLELAAAPVWIDDEIAGVLVIGFEISNGVAGDKRALLGFDVAVSTQGETYSSSLKTETGRQALEAQLGKVSGKMKNAISSGKPSDIVTLDVEGESYLTLIVPAVNAEVKDEIAYVIMGSVAESDFFDGSLFVLAIATVIAALIVLIIGFALASHFMRPIMTIEEGLLKIINGEYGHRFDVKSAEVGGLGFRINQLIGVLTGEDEQAEDEEQR